MAYRTAEPQGSLRPFFRLVIAQQNDALQVHPLPTASSPVSTRGLSAQLSPVPARLLQCTLLYGPSQDSTTLATTRKVSAVLVPRSDAGSLNSLIYLCRCPCHRNVRCYPRHSLLARLRGRGLWTSSNMVGTLHVNAQYPRGDDLCSIPGFSNVSLSSEYTHCSLWEQC